MEKRERRCDDLIQFSSEEEAVAEFNRLKISHETRQEYKAIVCPACSKWHLLHKSYTLVEGE